MARTVARHEEHPEKEWYSLDLKPLIAASLIAGLVFLVFEMVLVATIGGGTLWGPPRMIAAMVLGEGVLPPPATFDGSIVLTAVGVHFILSFILVAVLGAFIKGMNKSVATVTGGIFGFAVYFLNFYLVAPLAFPWFTMAQNWITLISHVAFGLAAGWAYKRYSS